jgi:hypothetical protein
LVGATSSTPFDGDRKLTSLPTHFPALLSVNQQGQPITGIGYSEKLDLYRKDIISLRSSFAMVANYISLCETELKFVVDSTQKLTTSLEQKGGMAQMIKQMSSLKTEMTRRIYIAEIEQAREMLKIINAQLQEFIKLVPDVQS